MIQNQVPDTTASGNITVMNSVPAGLATAGSAVEVSTADGMTAVGIQVTGTYTGALSMQATVDGVNWVTVSGAVTVINVNTSVAGATIASAVVGLFQAECSGFTKVRITALAAVTGTAVVTLRASRGASFVALDTPIPAGSAVIGAVTQSGAFTTTPLTPTPYTLNSAASTNLTSIKASAGTIYGLAVSNVNAAARYLKLYNKASAPVVATDIPVLVIPIPATGFVAPSIGALGHRFSTGIAIAITAAVADTDATAVALGDVKLLLNYV
jgi:hypothetical protein